MKKQLGAWSLIFLAGAALPAGAQLPVVDGVVLRPWPACCASALVVDLDGKGFRFTGREEGVNFDFDVDGQKERLAWTDPEGGDAFLVLERTGNGQIDDGKELFGGVTPQPLIHGETHGFAALRRYDEPLEGGNADGLISAADDVFSRLRLWRDANQDGRPDPAELSPLAAAGIDLIELAFRASDRRDRHGNRLLRSGSVLAGGRRYALAEVAFASD